MNKYFITLSAVALSFGAAYAAGTPEETSEPSAIGGTSVPVAEVDLLAPPLAGAMSSVDADPQAPAVNKPAAPKEDIVRCIGELSPMTTDEATRGNVALTPDVRSIVLPGDSKAVDGDSTNGNSGTPAEGGDLELVSRSALPSALPTPGAASPAINAQKGVEEGEPVDMGTPASAGITTSAAADDDESMVRVETTVGDAARALEAALDANNGKAPPSESPIIPSQMGTASTPGKKPDAAVSAADID